MTCNTSAVAVCCSKASSSLWRPRVASSTDVSLSHRLYMTICEARLPLNQNLPHSIQPTEGSRPGALTK